MRAPPTFFRWSTSVVIGGSVVCLSIGYFAARWTAPPATPPPRAEVSAATASSTRTEREPATETKVQPSWDDRWREKKARAVCPASTRDRAALLEELARTDPQRALRLALAESNLLVRDQLRDAVLRGWAAAAPDEAVSWAMARTLSGERMRCVAAALTGAAEHPEDAVRVALKACASDPQPAGDYGHSLINALVDRTGDFKAAADFARNAGMVDRQSYLIDSAYYQWAQNEPQRAFAELASITDPAARDAATKGVIEGSADSDARHLADYAKVLPEGDDRSRILAIALPEWAGKDPEAVMRWINEAGPSPDFDLGLAALARRPALMESRPEAAMELTDNIIDPVRRSLTKSDVFLNWARRDIEAATRYAQSMENPEYREMFLSDLQTVAAGRTP